MTTLSGTLLDSVGTPVTGTLWLTLSQQGIVSGTGYLAATVPVVFALTAGQVPGGSVVYGNDVISPSTTYYLLEAVRPDGSVAVRRKVVITGSTANLGTLVDAPTTATTLPPLTPIAGDVSGTLSLATVGKIQGRDVSAAAPAAGQLLGWNGSSWAPVSQTYSGSGTAGQLLKWASATGFSDSILSESGTLIEIQGNHSYGAGVTRLLRLTDAPDGNASDAGALSFRHLDRGNGFDFETALITSRGKSNGSEYWGGLEILTKGRDTSQATAPVSRLWITDTGAIMIGGGSTAPRAPLEITAKPTSIAAGYAGALRINCGDEADYGSPAANNLVAAQLFCNNVSMRDVSLWGQNIVLVQQGSPVPGASGIHLVGLEIEICNAATSGNEQLDPLGALANKIRGNGLELVGHSGSARRNAGGIMVWANDTSGAKWWDTGALLSRCYSKGIEFRKDTGDAVEPFQTALLDGKTLRLASQVLYRGSDGIGTDLFIRNYADYPVYMNLDSGNTATQQAYLFFGDRGASKFVVGKTEGNALVLGYHNRSTARTAIDIRDNGSAIQLAFFGGTPVTKGAVSGACAGNTAIKALLTYLASLGLLTDSTTA